VVIVNISDNKVKIIRRPLCSVQLSASLERFNEAAGDGRSHVTRFQFIVTTTHIILISLYLHHQHHQPALLLHVALIHGKVLHNDIVRRKITAQILQKPKARYTLTVFMGRFHGPWTRPSKMWTRASKMTPVSTGRGHGPLTR